MISGVSFLSCSYSFWYAKAIWNTTCSYDNKMISISPQWALGSVVCSTVQEYLSHSRTL